jgi:hypothetical protein
VTDGQQLVRFRRRRRMKAHERTGVAVVAGRRIDADAAAEPRLPSAAVTPVQNDVRRLLVSCRTTGACQFGDQRTRLQHDRAAGDVQDNASDPRRLFGSQEERCAGDVFGQSEPTKRMRLDQL